MEFKGFSIKSIYQPTDTIITPTFTFCELADVGRPEEIELHINVPNQRASDSAFFFSGTYARRLEADKVIHAIPIFWKENIPHTRHKGVDALRIVLLSREGAFADYEFGVMTRRGRFFLAAQQLYAGQLVKQGEEVCIFPTASLYNYPGSSYKNIWPLESQELVARVMLEQAELPEFCDVPIWSPVAASPVTAGVEETSDWLLGHCYYWHLISGTGVVGRKERGEHLEKTYFVHFKNILSSSPAPYLLPSMPVLFRLKEDNWGSQVIRSVKLAD